MSNLIVYLGLYAYMVVCLGLCILCGSILYIACTVGLPVQDCMCYMCCMLGLHVKYGCMFRIACAVCMLQIACVVWLYVRIRVLYGCMLWIAYVVWL